MCLYVDADCARSFFLFDQPLTRSLHTTSASMMASAADDKEAKIKTLEIYRWVRKSLY